MKMPWWEKSEYTRMIPYCHFSPSENDLDWVKWSLRYIYAEGKLSETELENLLKSSEENKK